LELGNKSNSLFGRAAKYFGIGEQKQLKLSVFIQLRSEKFEIGEQKQLKSTAFARPRSEKL
jgi:hypothetical protein